MPRRRGPGGPAPGVDLSGTPLTDPAIVHHPYSFAGDLVRRMVVYVDRAEVLAVG